MKKTLLATLVVALAIAAPALAQEKQGFFIGGTLGSSTIKLDDAVPDFEEFDFNEDDLGYKIFGGFRFLDFLGVEGGWVDFGNPTYSDDVLRTQVSLTGWNLLAVGYIPVGIFDLYGKLGYFWWDLDVDVSIDPVEDGDRFSHSDSDVVYGLGAAVWIKQISLRFEFERYDVAELSDVWLYSFGLAYTF